MPKKAFVILLLILYASSAFGIGIRQFYCCGKLKSTSIVVIRQTKEKCGNGDETSGCCQTKYQVLKVKDSHFAAGDITTFKNACDIHQFVPAVQIEVPVKSSGPIDYAIHAPPGGSTVPIYILHCVYRI